MLPKRVGLEHQTRAVARSAWLRRAAPRSDLGQPGHFLRIPGAPCEAAPLSRHAMMPRLTCVARFATEPWRE